MRAVADGASDADGVCVTLPELDAAATDADGPKEPVGVGDGSALADDVAPPLGVGEDAALAPAVAD